MKIRHYKAWKRAEELASKLLLKRDVPGAIFQQATRKLAKNRARLAEVFDEFSLLLRLLQDASNKHSKNLDRRKLSFALAAIIYFVNPFDFIPDAIPPLGYVDDLTFIYLAINMLQSELSKFKKSAHQTDVSSTLDPKKDTNSSQPEKTKAA